MRKNINRFALLVALLTFVVPLAFALIVSFEVEVRNTRDVPAKIELAQFHSEGFNGTRPLAFSDDLKIIEKTIEVPAHESRIVEFNSAGGGFWLRWRSQDQSNPRMENIVDLKPGKHIIELK